MVSVVCWGVDKLPDCQCPDPADSHHPADGCTARGCPCPAGLGDWGALVEVGGDER